MDKYLTTKEAANYLSIPLKTLYFYIHKNQIKHYKTGDKLKCRVLFKTVDLDNFLTPVEVHHSADEKANEYISSNPTESLA